MTFPRPRKAQPGTAKHGKSHAYVRNYGKLNMHVTARGEGTPSENTRRRSRALDGKAQEEGRGEGVD